MQMRSRVAIVCVVLGTLLAARPQVHAQAKAEVADVLRAAAQYLDDYDTRLSMLTCEERYIQTEQSGTQLVASRDLRSDVALVNLGDGEWLDFRDVFQVDGHAIRDHQQRVLDLFLHPSSDTVTQARRLADESSRFNIGHITRTINIPTFALTFLTRSNQSRSKFTIDSTQVVGGATIAVLRFAEQAMPRLIHSSDDAAATGRFWIDASSGRVTQTELMLLSAGGEAKIAVKYAPQPDLGLWAPVAMDEWYQGVPAKATTSTAPSSSSSMESFTSAAAREANEGHATYTNFKAFKVNVSVIIR